MKITKNILTGRKKWMILGSCALVIVMAAAVYLIVAWANSEASKSITDNRQAVISATTTLNAKLGDSILSNSDKIELINRYSLDLPSYLEATCGPQRGQFYSYLLPIREKCKASRESLQALEATLALIYTFMKQQAELADAIPSPTTLSLQQSYDTWSGVISKVDKIDVMPQLTDQKTTLTSALSAYRDAWKSLVDADTTKDKTGFVADQESLLSAYKTLQGAAGGLSEPLTSLVSELEINFQSYLAQTS